MQTLLSEPPGRGLLVAHLAVQGFEPCNALDEILEAAAGQYRGTYFTRVVVSRHSPLVAQLQLPHGVPALLVGRQGAVLGKAPLAAFGRGADIWEEEDAELAAACEVCGRTYPHEHVRAVYSSNCQDSDSGEEL
eukprot:gene9687-9845_t